MTRSRELAEFATSYDTGKPLGFRNRIINGDMRIDQRNNGAAVTSAGLTAAGQSYFIDRWRQDTTNNASFTYQQNAGSVTPPVGFTNYLGATSTAAYSPGSNTTHRIGQVIEGLNVADLAWGTTNAQAVTLSFWARSSLTGTHSGSISNNGGSRAYVYSFAVNSANTWEYKTVTIPGDTTGTWLKNNGSGLIVGFNLGTGTGTFGTTTANAWQAGNFVGLTNAVQVSATNGATFYITGVQLEAGSVATPFEFRDYGREEQMCLRYLPVASGQNSINSYFATGLNAGANSFALYPFKVTPRVPPTGITVSSPSHFGLYNGVAAFSASGVTFNTGSNDACFLTFTGATLTAGTAIGVYFQSASARIFFNGCEL